jgi:glycosyltransferase involved in cell wall biosynthesis
LAQEQGRLYPATIPYEQRFDKMRSDVTFIIPVYNGGNYLIEAIGSIKNQTRSDWRLLLIDDGSVDDSHKVMDSYTDKRIARHYNQKNVGLYNSLLEAIRLVNSEWVAILMQDDRLKPFYLEEMLCLIAEFPDAQAFWATEDAIRQDGRVLRKGRDTARTEIIEPGVAPWASILNRGCIWTISGSFTNRRLFTSIPFRGDLPHCGDYEWLLRATRHARFVYYERTLAELRFHPGQASAINLKNGRDVDEAYKIIKHNFIRYADDLPRLKAFFICFRRAKLVSRRAIAALLHRRFRYTTYLIQYVMRFFALPFIYKVRNAAFKVPLI